jgi:para-nitrobenzyl esterase
MMKSMVRVPTGLSFLLAMCFLYIQQSEFSGRFYVGSTGDLDRPIVRSTRFMQFMSLPTDFYLPPLPPAGAAGLTTSNKWMKTLILLMLAAAVSIAAFAVESKGTDGVVVKTMFGPVKGEREKSVFVFRGIRFAAPPVGPLRFRPPVPPSAWTEVRSALDFAPACPQLVEIDPTENNNSVMAEDCLAVNVWTPGADIKKRPVMVWIHGGGFIEGSARNTWYDGAKLAGFGDVVVVTLQYRMGALGFLDVSDLGGQDFAQSGNVGLLDQTAALKWVKENIAAFGGDPNNVTLFGQSAGAGSVGLSMVMRAARGLFHKAIMESGTPKEVADKARAIEVSRAYMKIAGVTSIEGLQKLSVAQMLDAQRKLFETRFGYSAFRPIIDGTVLNELPMQAIAAGRGTSVPILIGTNLDEIRLWPALYDLPLEQKAQSLLQKQLEGIVGSKAPQVIETYRKADENYGDAVIHLLGDALIRLPSIRFAETNSHRQPTYMYLFTYRSTSTYKDYGSCHGMELPFVFGVINDLDVIVFTGRGTRREALMNQLQQAWINFARSGDPSQPGLAWPRYDEQTRATMELGLTSRVVNDPNPSERMLWNGLPFDGVTPNMAKLWSVVWDNGTP